jgi:hypothetical protein
VSLLWPVPEFILSAELPRFEFLEAQPVAIKPPSAMTAIRFFIFYKCLCYVSTLSTFFPHAFLSIRHYPEEEFDETPDLLLA